MRCLDLDPHLEALADGSAGLTPGQQAHLAGCPPCRARLDEAVAIERWLAARDVPAPPATFTAMVMARISREEWRAERAIDLGFNLAVAVGVLVILMSGAGLAWSLGAFTISVDAEALLRAALSGVEGGRVMTELQTVALAAVLLTMALVVWWWAEAATD